MNKIHSDSSLDILNEIYSKCFKQSGDITSGISDIRKGVHPVGVIDKVKSKIMEKMENYEESLRMMERIIHEYSGSEKGLWKK